MYVYKKQQSIYNIYTHPVLHINVNSIIENSLNNINIVTKSSKMQSCILVLRIKRQCNNVQTYLYYYNNITTFLIYITTLNISVL